MSQDSLVGRNLGHYEVLEQLGAGGMGVVYRARDTRLQRSAAIKVLSEKFVADRDRKARFLQEARSASAINHPAVAQIYGVDEDDGIAYIAMELVEGRTVRQLVADKELDTLGSVEIAIQIAEGLAKAHETKIVHRDIKSDNVIVTSDGHAKILDFGLAKPLADELASDDALDAEATIAATMQATQAGMVVGTIGYMSPEQARGREIDHRSDVFSLGIVLYEMVTGQMPFRGDSPLDTLHAIAFEETKPVTAIRTNLPPRLHRVVARCLRKRPEDRFQSAEAVATELRDVARDIDSGITRGIPLLERLRDGLVNFRDVPRGDWMIPAAAAVGLVVAFVVSIVLDSGIFAALIPFTIFGLLVYRHLKNKPQRLVRGFGRKAAKTDGVRMVLQDGQQLTVVVEDPPAKTYVHLNSLVEKANSKLYFGDPFSLNVRELVGPEELRTLVQSAGVVWIDDELSLGPAPESGESA